MQIFVVYVESNGSRLFLLMNMVLLLFKGRDNSNPQKSYHLQKLCNSSNA